MTLESEKLKPPLAADLCHTYPSRQAMTSCWEILTQLLAPTEGRKL